MSERTARLDELLREEISSIIQRDVHDPRVGFVTITSVDVARDLGHATVWVSHIGTPEERRDALRALGRAMPFVRARLGVLRLKKIPELHLREDETAVRGTRVLELLHAIEAGSDPADVGPVETLPTPLGLPRPELDAHDASPGAASSSRPEQPPSRRRRGSVPPGKRMAGRAGPGGTHARGPGRRLHP